MKSPGVYALVRRTTGRIYIGSTSRAAGVIARLNEHRSKLRSGKHPSRHLQHDFSKYGIAEFDWWLLESCAAADAKQLEQNYLEQTVENSYNTLRKSNEYRPYSMAARQIIADRASKPFELEFAGVVYTGKNLTQFCRAHGLHQGAMTQVLLGKKRQFKGWTLPGSGLPSYRVRNHITGEELVVVYFCGTQAARKIGLNSASFNKLLRGDIAIYRGWTLAQHIPTEDAVRLSLVDKAERARINGRLAAVKHAGQPRRRRRDPLLHV